MGATIADREFDQVREGSFLEWPCSPDFDEERSFRGLRLAAPGRVLFGAGPERESLRAPAFARMVVCGACRLDAGYLDLGQDFLTRIVLVAVDARTHRARSGTMEIIPNRRPQPQLLPADALEGLVITKYWNPNVAHTLDLPEGETDYLVYATLGEYVSNVVRIELRRHEE